MNEKDRLKIIEIFERYGFDVQLKRDDKTGNFTDGNKKQIKFFSPLLNKYVFINKEVDFLKNGFKVSVNEYDYTDLILNGKEITKWNRSFPGYTPHSAFYGVFTRPDKNKECCAICYRVKGGFDGLDIFMQKFHGYLVSRQYKKLIIENTSSANNKFVSTDERDRTGKVRYGQGAFRDALISIKGASCWMSGIEGSDLLIASHIKRWSDCKGESESKDRGNINNGLLLSALWDAAFDSYLITFDEQWRVVASKNLSVSARQALGLTNQASLPEEFRNDERMSFIRQHRAVFDKKEATR